LESLGPEVIYDEARWRTLAAKRGRATPVLRALMGAGLEAYVFGSVARGDVRPESDVDVVILDPAPPYLVELAIERAGLRAYSKEIVQATPSYVPKAYIYLDPDEELVVSFPLATIMILWPGSRPAPYSTAGSRLGLCPLSGWTRGAPRRPGSPEGSIAQPWG